MIHYSCDLCGRSLTPDMTRYVLKMDVYASLGESSDLEDDSDVDHLEELSDMIDQLGDDASDEVDESGCQELRFDLCPQCRKKFLKDPLGRESLLKQLNFSSN